MPEITGTLENCIKDNYWGEDYIVWGNIYGDTKNRFRDGTHIHTSTVVKAEGDLLYTLNSVYRIGSWRDAVSNGDLH